MGAFLQRWRAGAFRGGITEKVSRGWLLARKNVIQRAATLRRGRFPKFVVFLSGVQRSGTNMMLSVLERSYMTEVFFEADSRAFENYQMRSRDVLRDLVRHSTAPCVVFKALCEAHELGSLLDDFAPAGGIWVVRDYRDVVSSQARKWDRMRDDIMAIAEDRDAAGWRGRGMSDSTHALVRKLCHPAMTIASAIALFWYCRNVLFFEHGLDRDDRVILVSYEAFVFEPRRECARLCEFLGLRHTARLSRQVSNPSIDRKSPPEIEPAVREICELLMARMKRVGHGGGSQLKAS